MKKTNNRNPKSTERPDNKTSSRKTTDNSTRKTDRKGSENSAQHSDQKSNPNRRNERLERAKKYSKKPEDRFTRTTKSEDGKKENEKGGIKKPFHSQFSEPQRYGLKKEDIRKAKREEKNSKYKDKEERFPKKSFKENRLQSKTHGKKDFTVTEKPTTKREPQDTGKSKYIKNLQKFSEKKKDTKRGGFLKPNPSTLSLSKPTPLTEEGTRLNKYLANSGVAARRKCDEIIEKGEVTVNGKVVKEMGFKVMPGDNVKHKNKLVKPVNYVYILLNKPKDYLTTVEDDKGRNTVMELISNATNERVYPVGRLDRNTTGLLLLTNDGEVAQKLAHPSFGAKKIYEVEVDKPITQAHMQKISDGVVLEDGVAIVDGIDYAHHTKRNIVGISLHIGKNRIVRRIFESLGYHVERLDRTLYAGLTKRDLPRGRWRYLTEREIIKLKYLK